MTHIEAEVPNLLASDENSVSRSLSTVGHMYQSACTSYSSRVYVNNVSRMPSNKA